MARHLFGSVADYVISVGVGNAATLQPGATVTCWSAAVGGVQYTDLTATDGVTPIAGGSLTADASGAVPEFMGPDNVRAVYLDANGGSGPRRRTFTTDLDADFTAVQDASVPKSAATARGDMLVASAAGAVGALGVGANGQTLVPDSVAGIGVRWGNGWRRRDLPAESIVNKLADEVPAVTLTQQSTSTIPSAQPKIAPDSGKFLYLNAGDFVFGTTFPDTEHYKPLSRYPNTYDSGQNSWSVEFMTDAAVFDYMFKCVNTSGAYRLSVDGRIVADVPLSNGATAAGSRHVLTVNFGTSRMRRIRVDTMYMPFGGVYIGPNDTIRKPTRFGGRMGVLGDSISDGSAENTGFALGTWFGRAARMLGCTDAWDQARGGTGYITPGSWATLGDRVDTDVTPYSFDRLFVWAGYNDNLGDQAAIGNAASALFSSLLAVCAPGADIIVLGCWEPTGAPAGSITNTDNTIKAAALGAGLPFVSPLTGGVYDGAGNLLDTHGPFITAANKGAFIGADNVHPTDAGHEYLARVIVEAVKVLMPE